jgi:uridine phosphorylase
MSTFQPHAIPILEFDSSPTAILQPEEIHTAKPVPPRCVLCFFPEVIESVCGGGRAVVVHTFKSEIGPNPVYQLEVKGQSILVMHPGVGSALAAGFLEEVIALGARQIIACGSAGVLDGALAVGHVVVPSSAIRDEGTSYHYLPPSREAYPHPQAVHAIEAALQHHHVPYVLGKTWTTDGLYRETRARMEARRAEGCLTVEMEASAFFAVAQFRDVVFGQLLYSGDDLSGDNWDSRDFLSRTSTREKLFWLAVESVLNL